MKVYIKNMVCLRCQIFVENELKKLGINYIQVDIGEVTLKEELSDIQRLQLNTILKPFGLELITKRKNIIVEKVKHIITELIHHSNEALTIRFSDYLRRKMNYDYTYLANLFSEVEGKTIESYIISKKIECVKELILSEELTLTEIAFKLHYSSVAHLSYQFKKVTGLTPSQFKAVKNRELLEISSS